MFEQDIGSNVFFTPRRALDEDFIPPLVTTLAELLCGFPGLSGAGGMVLGSAPGNLSNFLFPVYNDNGIPFQLLKYWSSGSRMIDGNRVYRRQFEPDVNPKISFKFRVDPWGYHKWGGHPLSVISDFGYARARIIPYSRKIFKEADLTEEKKIETLLKETPELVITLANKRRAFPDLYDKPSDIIPSDFSLSIMVGNPSVAVCSINITELEFCQTLPQMPEGDEVFELVKRRVKHNTETVVNNPLINFTTFTEPFDEVRDIKDSEMERDDVFGIEFEIDKSLVNRAENLLEVTFMLVVEGRMTTIPDLIYVGKDKSVLKEQESLDMKEVQGPLSWVPQTTVYPIVEGTHPRDVKNSFLENRPNKISDFDMFVKKSGRYT